MNARRIVVWIVLLSALCACGTKGDLVLPDPASTPQSPPTESTPVGNR